jgi:drug/metabolite transporter (DMT)-like permease
MTTPLEQNVESTLAAQSAARLHSTAMIALFASILAFALTPVMVRLSEVGPTATGFWRMAFAIPILLLLMRRENTAHPRRAPTRRDYLALFGVSLIFAVEMGLWQSIFLTTTIANATLIGYSSPIFVTIGAWLIFGERITPLFLAGLALSLAGIGLLVSATQGDFGPFALGDLLAATCALMWGAYILGLKGVLRVFGPMTAVTWNTSIAALLILPAAALLGETIVPVTLFGWFIVVAYGLFVHAAGQSLITYAYAHLPASFNSVAALAAPVLAIIFAWVLFAEPLSLTQILFAALVLAGIMLAKRGQE